MKKNAYNGFRPNVFFSDELEWIKENYTPEQIKKMWKNCTPKSSKISNKVIITRTPKSF